MIRLLSDSSYKKFLGNLCKQGYEHKSIKFYITEQKVLFVDGNDFDIYSV